MRSRKTKENKNWDYYRSIINNRVVIGLLLIISVFFFLKNGNLNEILGINFNKFFKNQIDTARVVPTPTPELPIPCIIGKFSLDLLRNRCDSLQNYIEIQKQADISTVEQLISGLNARIQKLNTPSNNTNQSDFKGQLEKALEGCGGNESEVHICKLNTLGTLAQIWGQNYQEQQKLRAQLEEQLYNYQNYLSKIRFGGIGNGACSSHEGVDCSTPRGNIGQVMCADGWRQSQVYYFNVKECVEYTELTFTQ